MKTAFSAALIAGLMTLSASGAFAADVKGDVKTNVLTGAVIQTNTGIANKNEANLGSVSGKSTDVGGDFKSTVKTGVIYQKNTGIANKNEVNMGSVTD